MIARVAIAAITVLLFSSLSSLAAGLESQSGVGQGSKRPSAHGDDLEKTAQKHGSNSTGHHENESTGSFLGAKSGDVLGEQASFNQQKGSEESEGSASSLNNRTEETHDPVAGDDRPATVVRSFQARKTESRVEKASTRKPTVVRAKGADKEQPHVYRGVAPCLAWVDRTKPITAVLVCVHGLGLHNGTYEAFGKRMSDLGYATYAIDVRGFGAWMQAKGRERVDFEHCINDVRTTLKVVRRAHPACPVFLLGESMGGAIALRVTSMYPDLVDGLISSVPAGDRFKHTKTSLKVGFHLIKHADKPINMGEGVVKQATKNPELRKVWLEDPLARMNLSARELLQFQNFMNGNQECARNIRKTAVLIVQGCQDKLVRPEGTVELFNHLATNDREIVLIPNAEHLIFEEAQFTDKEIATVDSWIAAHLQKALKPGEGSGEEKNGETTGAVKGDLE